MTPLKIRRCRVATVPIAGALLMTGGLLVCIKNPVQKNIGGNGMTLTLEDRASTEATFSGKPITAYLTVRDSIPYEDLAWHMGSGNTPQSSIPPGKKIKEARVTLLWNIMPVKKDSLGKYYDSVYVSRGGEIYRSNAVRVNVTNIAPVIDSVKISKRVYFTQDTIRDTVKPYDSLLSVTLRVFAHDLNQNPLTTSWPIRTPRLSYAENSLNASYVLPHANFTDTMSFTVSDGRGGDCSRVIYITSKGYRNRPPIIDSIKVKDSVFSGVSPVYYAAVAVADSITLRVFARDSDLTDNISVQWTDKNVKQVALKPKAAEMTMVWACTSSACKDTVSQGTLKILDTVTITVSDNDSASAVKTVIIVKGYLGPNKPPVFDSLRANDTLVKGAWTIVRFQATCRDTIRFRMYGHDPDSADTAHWTVRSADTTRIRSPSDSAATYVCRDTLYKDTVTFLLSDKHLGSTVRQVWVDVNNRYPLLDSVKCADTVFKSTDSVYNKNVSVGDSVVVKVYCRDPDAGDSASVRWSLAGLTNDTARFKNITGYQALYLCKDTIMPDTCAVRIFDKRKAAVKKRLCMNICNHRPTIDSIICADTVFKAQSAMFSKACAGNDSVFISIFAHDPDAADSLRDTLYAAGKLSLIKLGALQYRYICKDSTYTDTLSTFVNDAMTKTAIKKIRLSITKK